MLNWEYSLGRHRVVDGNPGLEQQAICGAREEPQNPRTRRAVCSCVMRYVSKLNWCSPNSRNLGFVT